MKIKRTAIAMLSLSMMSFTLANTATGIFPRPSLRQLAQLKADSLHKAVLQLRVTSDLLEYRAGRLQLIAQSN